MTWIYLAVPILAALIGWFARSLFHAGRWSAQREQADTDADRLQGAVAELRGLAGDLRNDIGILRVELQKTVEGFIKTLSELGGQLTKQDTTFRDMFVTKDETRPMFAKAAEDHVRYDRKHDQHDRRLEKHSEDIAALQAWQTIVQTNQRHGSE